MNERKLVISELNQYTSALKGDSDKISESLNKFKQALNDLTSMGIIVGARTNTIEGAASAMTDTSQRVTETLMKFIDFVNKDVVAETSDLESRQANELSNMIDGFKFFNM